MIKDVDILIIGTGCGGGMMAHELSKLQGALGRPLKILILESGPETQASLYNNKELDMSMLFQDNTNRFTSDRSTQILQGHAVGGGTLLYSGTAHKAPADVLNSWATTYGLRGFSDGEMAPHFQYVAELLNRTPQDKQELWNDNNRYFWEAMKAKQFKRDYLHRFMNSCIGCGFCYYGCRFHRKMNGAYPLTYHARRRGAELIANCHVHELFYDDKSQRLGGAYAYLRDAFPGTIPNRYPRGPVKVNARLTILCGGPINNPAVLLNSKIPGLSPAVGKYYLSQTTNTLDILMPFPVTMVRGFPKTSTLFEFQQSHRFILTPSNIHPITTAVDITGFGADYTRSIERFNQLLQWQLIAFDDPIASNCVTLKNGIPQIDYTYREDYIERMIFGMKVATRMALDPPVSAERIYIGPSEKGYITRSDLPNLDNIIHRRYWKTNKWNLNTAHPQGSCRMGSDPNVSVVDGTGRAHNVKGLMIVDTSIHPTPAHTNPAYTAYAVAKKIAEDTKKDIRLLLGE